MNLGFDGEKCEADFVALLSPDQMDGHTEPELVIGEAKSFGKGELVKAHDLSQLKKVGRKLPGAYILIAVMRNEFTPTEKTLLKKFALWGRRLNDRGRATNPVILLTGHELFMRYRISSAWKELGREHAKYADFNHHRNLYEFAQATQAIHLGLPSFFEGRMAKRKHRAQHKDRFEKEPGAGSNRG